MLRAVFRKTFILFFLAIIICQNLVASSIEVQVDSALSLLAKDRVKCVEYTKLLLEESQRENNLYGLVKSNFILGYLRKREGDFGKAIIYYLEGIRYAKDAKYGNATKDLVGLLKNTGNVFKKFNNYESAKSYYQKGMDLAIELGEIEKYTDLVYLTAEVMKDEGKGDEAAKLLESTFEHFNHISKNSVADIYNLLGQVYSDLGNERKAVDNFNKLQDYVEGDEKLEGLYYSWSFHNLGELYFNLGNFEDANKKYKKALEYKLKIKASEKSLFYSYRDLGETLIFQENYSDAYNYLKRAEKLYSYAKNVPEHYTIYKLLSICSQEIGKLDEFSNYQHLYASSLENYLAEQRQIEAADKKYNLELIIQRYFARVAEQERYQQIQYYSAVGGSFLVTLIVLILAFYQYRKYRLRRDLETSLKPYIKNAF